MKLIFVALVFATISASTGAIVVPKDDHNTKDNVPAYPNESKGNYDKSPEYNPSAPHDDTKSYETGKPYETNSHTRRAVSCLGQHPWQANLAYVAGDQVIYNDILWTAAWWSYNTPPGVDGSWTEVDTCIAFTPPSDPVDCTGVSPWSPTTVYLGGSQVTYNGHLWVAVQWTTSNSPGDTSGTWKNIGTCV